MPIRDVDVDFYVQMKPVPILREKVENVNSEFESVIFTRNDEIKKKVENVRKPLKTSEMTKSTKRVENVSHGGKRAGAGRPRLYENAAERQRAYMARKKEAG